MKSSGHGKYRRRLSVIWLLCAPGLVFLIFQFLVAAIAIGSRNSESAGWMTLGLTLILFLILLVLTYGSLLFTFLIDVLGWVIIRSTDAPTETKTEVVVAFVVSLLTSIWVLVFIARR